MKKMFILVMVALLLVCNLTAYADNMTYTEGTLYYTINDGSISITGCFSKNETVEIPSQIAGIPVNTIASGAFIGNEYVKTVILPETITSIEEGAFDAGITVAMKQTDNTSGETEEIETPAAENSGTAPEVYPTEPPKAGATPTVNTTAEPADTPTVTPSSTTALDASSASYTTIVIQSGDTSESSTEGAVDEADAYLEEEFEEEPVIMAAADGGEAESPAPEADEPAREQAEESSSSPAPFIIIGVLAAAAIAAAVIILKKKKQ